MGVFLAAALCVRAVAKDSWTKVETPFFTLLAQTDSVRKARDWAVDFEQFRLGMERVLGVKPTSLEPALIVIFKNEKTFRPFQPVGEDGKRREVNGFAGQLPTQTVILTSFDNFGDGTKHAIYWGGAQWFLRGSGTSGSDWFRAGFGELFKTFRVQGDEFTVGDVNEHHVEFLRSSGLVPLNQLFGVEMKDLPFQQDVRTDRFYGESWLFLHYCVFGRTGPEQGGLASEISVFVDAVAQGAPEWIALQQAFGQDVEGLTKALTAYLQSGRYGRFSGKFTRENVAAGFVVRPATATEVGIAQAQACLATGNEVGARGYLGEAQLAASDEPDVWVAYGDYAELTGDKGGATNYYLRAVEGGTRIHRAWHRVAEAYVLNAAAGQRGFPRFDPERAREAADRYEMAIECYPYFLPSYERVALLLPSLAAIEVREREVLERGLKLAPKNPTLLAGLGLWEIRHGEVEVGSARVEALLAEKNVPQLPAALAKLALAEGVSLRAEAEVRRLMAAGQAAEAGTQLDAVIAKLAPSPRRSSLIAFRREIGRVELIEQAERALAAGKGTEAATLLESVSVYDAAPALQARVQALKAKARALK